MNDADWTPKSGDKAWYALDTEVVIVGASKTPGIYMVRYARKDNFGERAEFAADRLELTPMNDLTREQGATLKPEHRPKHCKNPKCGKVIKYVAKRGVWVHATPGADHPPMP